MTVYLDASVLVATLIVEAKGDAAVDYVQGLDEPPIVTGFAAGEVASAISRAVRTGRVAVDLAVQRLEAFDAFRAVSCQTISLGEIDIDAAAKLVRHFDLKLRMPDALHLTVSKRHGLVLATFDLQLARAAHALGVEVAIP